ncbi:MAG: hypothetical protein PUG67_08960 [Peptoniphilaceae bacterium]|nr:hypothetical protein [Peptoniphilaceae bacterium]MDY6018549.1 hypothetical protein [Anaerococcus sp.]
MKVISRLLNTLAGIFRILMTMLFLWGIVFTIFVDRDLLTSLYDLLGFDSIAPEIIKIITAIIFAFFFFINLIVSQRIFKANKTGKYHMSNMFFGFVFLLIDLGMYFFIRDKNIFYLFGFSLLLILGSMIGLGAKAKGLYKTEENEQSLEDNSTQTNKEIEEEEINDAKDKEVLEKEISQTSDHNDEVYENKESVNDNSLQKEEQQENEDSSKDKNQSQKTEESKDNPVEEKDSLDLDEASQTSEEINKNEDEKSEILEKTEDNKEDLIKE